MWIIFLDNLNILDILDNIIYIYKSYDHSMMDNIYINLVQITYTKGHLAMDSAGPWGLDRVVAMVFPHIINASRRLSIVK